jgi:hypothetical protein
MYFVFAYDAYYPGGGMADYMGTYPTLEVARLAAQAAPNEYADVATVRDGALVLVAEWHRHKQEWKPC